MAKKKLRIIPLGGHGEIGKNMGVIEYGNNILIIDTGIMFPESDMLGVDLVLPDWNYLNDKWGMVRGICITHGHEDHTGAIAYVLQNKPDIPVYATPLTRGLIEVKLKYAKMLQDVNLNTVKAGDKVYIGPFEVEFFHVTHSIPDCVGLGITTPVGLIVHTGDFKIDQTPVDGWPMDFVKLAEFAGRGVLALMGDSTNADKEGWTPSEKVIDRAFDEVFSEAKGRIMVASFASAISRVQQVMDAADRHGRKLALMGTSMVKNVEMAMRLGYLNDRHSVLVPFDDLTKMPDSKFTLMMTGSQGEPGAVVGRLAAGTHKQLSVQPGDTVVLSSHPIPGNEESVSRAINRLLQKHAKVIYHPLKQVHVSGHGNRENQKFLINLLQPKFMIPVHGELRHLMAHAELAVEMGVPRENIIAVENGHVIELTEDSIKVVERVPGGYVFVDGAGIGDIGPEVLKERDTLARYGFVVVKLVLDGRSGKLLSVPEIETRGFVHQREADDLLEEAIDRAERVATKNRNGKLGKQVEKELSDYFYSTTRRRPVVVAVVAEV